MITDKLASYGAAKREIIPGIEHLASTRDRTTEPRIRTSRHAEESGKVKRFKSAGQAQRFLSAHDQINNFFHLRRGHVTAAEHRASRTQHSRSGRNL
jgi:putative transposase